MMGLLPDVAADLGISIPSAGHLVSAYALGVVIGAPLLAALTARMSRRAVLIGLMVLFVAGNALLAFAPDEHYLLAARFLSGLPHGAFFGVGAVVATTLAAPERKARSVSLMFLGLTVANIAGVPVATLMGQHLGWRAHLPRRQRDRRRGDRLPGAAHPARRHPGPRHRPARRTGRPALAPGLAGARHHGRGLRRAVRGVQLHHPDAHGRGGLRRESVTLLLALFGVGATIGNLLGGRLADHAMRGTLFGGLLALAAVLFAFPLLMRTPATAALAVALLGTAAFVTGSPLQLMVMEKAAAAPSLASSANQAAFNLANAGGAWIGGLSLAAGFGTTSPALAGALLAVLGLAVAGVAYAVDHRQAARRGRERLVAGHVPAEAESVRG
ncbi:Transmembrane efflux protein OS=Streptomyces glaucescens OX=1907 GN=SGLAU_10205 PE=4 SV=1 [Streptomyces glaucescens]